MRKHSALKEQHRALEAEVTHQHELIKQLKSEKNPAEEKKAPSLDLFNIKSSVALKGIGGARDEQ